MFKFFDQLLNLVTRLLSNAKLQTLLKVSPFLIIPILLFVLGQQYLEKVDDQKKRAMENERLGILLKANPELKLPLGQFVVRRGFNEQEFNDFMLILQEQMTATQQPSLKEINRALVFMEQNRQLHGTAFQHRMAMDYFRSLAADKALTSRLFAQMQQEANRHEDEGIDRLTNLLMTDEFVNGPNCLDLKQPIMHFVAVYKIRKSKRKKILPCKN